MSDLDHTGSLRVAIEEARAGLAEGGIPIGGALFRSDGTLLGRGHNRRVQQDDPSVHGETDAFRNAGRQRSYRDTIMVTTLASRSSTSPLPSASRCWARSSPTTPSFGTRTSAKTDDLTGASCPRRRRSRPLPSAPQ